MPHTDLDFDEPQPPVSPPPKARERRREEPSRPASVISAESDYERGEYLLSCCMQYGAEVMEQCEAGGIESESFIDSRHEMIYGKILRVWRRERLTDVHLVKLELDESGQYDQIGGSSFLYPIAVKNTTTAVVRPTITALAGLAVKRKLQRFLAVMAERAANPALGGAELLSDAATEIARMTKGTWRAATAWSVVSATALCASQLKPPPELICGLLYQGGTMMMSGPSKAHKTYTMIAAALSIAGGHPWLGFRTAKAPVIYINLELQDFAMKTRVHAIAEALGINPSTDLHILNLRGVMVSLDELRLRLGSMIERTGAKLTVIDPHYKISAASGVEENSNDDQAAFLYAIETLCAEKGSGALIGHHFAKGNASMKNAIDRASGGGALARWPDVVMTMTEHDEEGCMTVDFALRNFAPVKAFVIRWEHPRWKIEADLDPVKLKDPGGRRDLHPAEEILRALGAGRMTKEEIRDSLGWDDRGTRRKINKLLAAKKLGYDSHKYWVLGVGETAASIADVAAAEPARSKRTLNPKDFLAKFAAHFKGEEKAADARKIKARADEVFGTLRTDEWRQLLPDCITQGVLNKTRDGRYYSA